VFSTQRPLNADEMFNVTAVTVAGSASFCGKSRNVGLQRWLQSLGVAAGRPEEKGRERERGKGRENQERVRGLFPIFPCRFQQLQYLESTGAKPQQAVTICPRFIVTQEPFATKPW